MIFKIYIGISILCSLLFCLYSLSLVHEVKIRYADKIKETEKVKKDVAGNILAWMKMFLICFIPIYNVFLFFVLIFMSDKIKTVSNKRLKAAFETKEENNQHGKSN